MTPPGDYIVWARRSSEEGPSERCTRPTRGQAESEAIHIAKASGDEGAMSVYVTDPSGVVVWAAGEEWVALHEAGVQTDSWGKVLDPTDQAAAATSEPER